MKNTTTVNADYTPQSGEPYMNDTQLEYFKNKLIKWREDLLSDSRSTLKNLQEDSVYEPDATDRASHESDTAFELRTRDRYRKLIEKIDFALERVENKEYGYCLETGEEIGLKRLEARPVATLTIEAQEKHERNEKIFVED